jgi:ergothioneine biosynthesis protein EgtC
MFMCRWVAYLGEPVFLEDVVTRPSHSLIHQSQQATEAKTGTNGDGFGIGWYGRKAEPGAYRELRPAWSDENLLSICEQVQSRLFFAHVRASTGTATSRANCHPFISGKYMFMHNGQVGCYGQLRRRIENMIPDDVYANRNGTTDSEAIFLIALMRGKTMDPVAAMASTLSDIKAMMADCAICEPLRFTAALTDGENLYAFRWSCDDKAPTLYWKNDAGGLLVVSEPLDDTRANWQPIPQGHVLIARKDSALRVEPFIVEAAKANDEMLRKTA